MPKIINSTFQSTVVGQKFSFKADIDFIQQDIRDNYSAIIESIIGSDYDSTKTYILKGCEVSSSGGITTVSEGYIFGISNGYGNMPIQTYLYYHIGSVFSDPSGGDVIICKTLNNFSSSDPTEFTDGTPRRVHDIITIEFLAGTSGTGNVDYTDMIRLFSKWSNITTFSTNWLPSFALPPRYIKDFSRKVNLEGFVSVQGGAPGLPVCTLPVGYRPLKQKMFPCVVYDSLALIYYVRPIIVNVSGVIAFLQNSDLPPNNSGSGVDLNSISFTIQ